VFPTRQTLTAVFHELMRGYDSAEGTSWDINQHLFVLIL